MKHQKTHCIGLMSGTSLDGVDLCYVIFDNHTYNFEILHTNTVPYTPSWKKKLQNAFHLKGEQLTKLDMEYGKYLGAILNLFIQENKIAQIDFIASHGHTVFHNPKQGYTLQIGNGAAIAATTNQKIICDFRTQDVAKGGQGAPLVPIGDALLFDTYDYCLNIGGFANVSFQKQDKRLAYDICPANIVLNYYANQLALPYDDKGEIAAKGKVNQNLLYQLNDLAYFNQKPPKSLGYEFVHQTVLPLIEGFKISEKEVLATFVEHISAQIALNIDSSSQQKMLVTGGGAHNQYLIKSIQKLTHTKLIIPEKTIIDYKESLIFAFLGLLKIQHKNNCLASVTGATHDHCSGVIYECQFISCQNKEK